jgi:hypothetical protein
LPKTELNEQRDANQGQYGTNERRTKYILVNSELQLFHRAFIMLIQLTWTTS